jgi:hypothetical protein
MKSHRQLEGMSITGKISNGQEEVPLEHIITCGRELRVPEVFSPQALAHANSGVSLYHPVNEPNGVGQHGKLRGAIRLLKSPNGWGRVSRSKRLRRRVVLVQTLATPDGC